MMIQKIDATLKMIGSFIIEWLYDKDNFGCRSFYGETFSLALLQRAKLLDTTTKEKLLNAYIALDKTDTQFHWEFNNYAVLDYLHNSEDDSVRRFLEPLVFKNTPCTNWTLLRSNTRLIAGIDTETALAEAREKIRNFQLPSGLILDDPGVKSFQYHCFSMAMIAEIYENTHDDYFMNRFLHGVEFIRNFILSNGETLYIGRGQNQSFGYGALLYILALAFKYTEDKTLLGDIGRVMEFLLRHRRGDGSFPLVMNGMEKTIPEVIDMQDPEFAGWYPYNNYFDYLPFMGFFLAKAYNVLKGLDTADAQYRPMREYRDDDFIKIVKPGYEAVLSKPGGYWSNDLPIPYVVTKGRNITPCYGGEQFQKSLYRLEGIPLPVCKLFNKSIRWKSISFLSNNRLWLISPMGVVKRDFVFEDEYIQINTAILSPLRFKHLYLFLEDGKKICKETDRMIFEGYEFSASGRLSRYADERNTSIVRLNIES
jgi:hypothetical protein